MASIRVNGQVSWQKPIGANDLLIYLLKSFIKSAQLNLRTLKKLYGMDYIHNSKRIVVYSNSIKGDKLSLAPVFDFLLFLFGDTENLLKAIEATTFTVIDDYHNVESMMVGSAAEMIFIIAHKQHNFSDNGIYQAVSHNTDERTRYTVVAERGYLDRYLIVFKERHDIKLRDFKLLLMDSIRGYMQLTTGDIL
jgi:hypothetical protein